MEHHKPAVSVIVPVYNVEKYLAAALDSVLGQTFADFELICIEDGSRDASGEILKSYAARNKRIRAVFQENKGVSHARNRGMDLAEGAYIAFLDSDDAWHPQFLEIMFAAAQAEKTDFAWCGYRSFSHSEKISAPALKRRPPVRIIRDVWKMFVHRTRPRPTINVWNKLYRAAFVKRFRFNERICSGCEDFLFSHYVVHAARGAAFVDCPLVWYRIRPDSLTHRGFSARWVDDHIALLSELIPFFAGRKMDDGTRRALYAHLSKTILKKIILDPYLTDRKNCEKHWAAYADVLRRLIESGVFYDRYLDARNRLLLYLLLRRRFRMIKFVLIF